MSDEKNKSTARMADDLHEAAGLCDDELGEWWRALAELYPRVLDGGSDGFLDAYEKELRAEHARLKKEFRVVEEKVTRTHRVKELRHISEISEEDQP